VAARGRFITFEGPEGGGKTTQARRLIARLEACGLTVHYTREPGGTPTGEAIRDILQHDTAGEPIHPETEVLLFEASRAQLVRDVIAPALERGDWVICDRYADSTTVYQGYGRGFPVEQMIAINRFAIGAMDPELTILIDIDIEQGFRRIDARGAQPDRIESEAREFHRRVRAGYLELADRFRERYRIVDGDRPEADVEASIWEIVESELDPKS
jgi:dTMP kinase